MGRVAFHTVLQIMVVTILFARGSYSIKEYLKFSDLSALDSSDTKVREAFRKEYNMNPDGIALNKETRFAAVQPPITVQYNRYCYKEIGRVTYTYSSYRKEIAKVLGESTVENKSSSPAKLSTTVSASWTDTVSHSTTNTLGLAFSAGVTIEGIFEMGMSFSFETSHTETKEQSTSQEKSDTIEVEVPAGSRRKVAMVATMTEQTAEFNAPIQVSGYFGANFPSRARGHYFWFSLAKDILPKTSGQVRGTVTGLKALNVHTIIEDAVALTTTEMLDSTTKTVV